MKLIVISYVALATLGLAWALGQKSPKSTAMYDVANEGSWKR
jgi:hypothetical protein